MRNLVSISFLVLCHLGGTAQKGTLPMLKQSGLKSTSDSVQYALGSYFGQWMLNNGLSLTDQSIFITALNNVLKNSPRAIKDDAVEPIITRYRISVQRELAQKQEIQLFSALKDKPGVGKLPSGVQYLIQQPGKGARPADTDSVMINFKGTLPNGTVFEDTYAKKISVATTPKTLMPGLSEALQLMPVGAIWEVYIPSALAFGEKGNGQFVPPNSAVIMLVELISIKRNN